MIKDHKRGALQTTYLKLSYDACFKIILQILEQGNISFDYRIKLGSKYNNLIPSRLYSPVVIKEDIVAG